MSPAWQVCDHEDRLQQRTKHWPELGGEGKGTGNCWGAGEVQILSLKVRVHQLLRFSHGKPEQFHAGGGSAQAKGTGVVVPGCATVNCGAVADGRREHCHSEGGLEGMWTQHAQTHGRPTNDPFAPSSATGQSHGAARGRGCPSLPPNQYSISLRNLINHGPQFLQV